MGTYFTPEWDDDCRMQRGKVLTGKYRHWCNDWDLLPIDETCPEWPCACFQTKWQRLRYRLYLNDLYNWWRKK